MFTFKTIQQFFFTLGGGFHTFYLLSLTFLFRLTLVGFTWLPLECVVGFGTYVLLGIIGFYLFRGWVGTRFLLVLLGLSGGFGVFSLSSVGQTLMQTFGGSVVFVALQFVTGLVVMGFFTCRWIGKVGVTKLYLKTYLWATAKTPLLWGLFLLSIVFQFFRFHVSGEVMFELCIVWLGWLGGGEVVASLGGFERTPPLSPISAEVSVVASRSSVGEYVARLGRPRNCLTHPFNWAEFNKFRMAPRQITFRGAPEWWVNASRVKDYTTLAVVRPTTVGASRTEVGWQSAASAVVPTLPSGQDISPQLARSFPVCCDFRDKVARMPTRLTLDQAVLFEKITSPDRGGLVVSKPTCLVDVGRPFFVMPSRHGVGVFSQLGFKVNVPITPISPLLPYETPANSTFKIPETGLQQTGESTVGDEKSEKAVPLTVVPPLPTAGPAVVTDTDTGLLNTRVALPVTLKEEIAAVSSELPAVVSSSSSVVKPEVKEAVGSGSVDTAVVSPEGVPANYFSLALSLSDNLDVVDRDLAFFYSTVKDPYLNSSYQRCRSRVVESLVRFKEANPSLEIKVDTYRSVEYGLLWGEIICEVSRWVVREQPQVLQSPGIIALANGPVRFYDMFYLKKALFNRIVTQGAIGLDTNPVVGSSVEPPVFLAKSCNIRKGPQYMVLAIAQSGQLSKYSTFALGLSLAEQQALWDKALTTVATKVANIPELSNVGVRVEPPRVLLDRYVKPYCKNALLQDYRVCQYLIDYELGKPGKK